MQSRSKVPEFVPYVHRPVPLGPPESKSVSVPKKGGIRSKKNQPVLGRQNSTFLNGNAGNESKVEWIKPSERTEQYSSAVVEVMESEYRFDFDKHGNQITRRGVYREEFKSLMGDASTRLTGGEFANGAATAAFMSIVSLGAKKAAIEEVEILGAGSGGAGKRKMNIGRRLLSKDEDGNLIFAGEVGYETSERGKAEEYVEGINREHTVKHKGQTKTLIVNMSLTADGSGGDIRIVSFETLFERAAVGKNEQERALYRKQLWNESKGTGDCVLACAAVGANMIYFRWYPQTHGLHETFHLIGFLGHPSGGIMQHGGSRRDLRYQDLRDLDKLYF